MTDTSAGSGLDASTGGVLDIEPPGGSAISPDSAPPTSAMLQAVLSASSLLLTAPDPTQVFPAVLEALALGGRFHRVMLFRTEVREGVVGSGAIAEWHQPHLLRQMDVPGGAWFPHSPSPEFAEPLSQGRPVCIHISKSSEPARSFFRSLGIKTTIGVPVRISGRVWGSLVFDDCEHERAPTTEEMALLQSTANLIGQALARQSAEEQARQSLTERQRHVAMEREASAKRRSELLLAVAQVSAALARVPGLHDGLQEAARLLLNATGVDRVSIFALDSAAAGVRLLAGAAQPGYALDPSVKATLFMLRDFPEVMAPLMRGEIYCSPTAQKSDANRDLNARLGVKTDLHVPILVDGQFWGQINLDDCREQRSWTDGEIETLIAAAEVVSASLRRRQIEQQTAKAISEEQAKRAADLALRLDQSARVNSSMARLVGQLQSESDLDQLVPAMLETCAEIVGANAAAVILRDASNKLRVQALVASGRAGRELSPAAASSNGGDKADATTLSVNVDALAAPTWIDAAYSPHSGVLAALTSEGAARHVALVPLRVADQPAGLCALAFASDRRADIELSSLLENVGQYLALALRAGRLGVMAREAATLRERNRLAREIHDTLAQGLIGVVLHLRAAVEAMQRGSTLPEDRQLVSRVSSALALAESSLGEARRSVRALLPPKLDDMTLPNALRSSFEDTLRGHDVTASFDIDEPQVALPDSVQATLLRICQEAAANIVKHARATKARLSLSQDDGTITLHIEDNGVGFESGWNHAGFGLRIMRERAEDVGAQLRVSSGRGQGTQLEVRVRPQL